MNQINPYRHGGEALAFDGFGNRSRNFNGVDDEVIIPDSPSFPTGAQTWSCWVKPSRLTFGASGQDLMTRWGSQGANELSALLWLANTGIGTPQFYISSNGSNAFLAASSDPLTVDTWHHVVGVFTPNTSIKIYVDGVLKGTNTTSIPSAIKDTPSDFVIGWRDFTFDAHFKGNICDCRIYDTDLTATDISNLYNGTNITTNLVGHWLTDADNMLDAAGTNHGTNYGTKYSYDNPSPPVEFGSASRSFNGSSHYVDLGDSDDFSFGDGANDSPFSVCFWAKVANNNKFRAIGKNVAGTYEWLVATDALGFLTFYLIDGTTFYGRRYNTALTENEWLHISATYDGTGGSNFRDGMAVYINNVRVDDFDYGDNSYVAMTATSNPLEIAKFQTTYANGKMADVRLYNAELTASQVSDLYSGTDVQTNLVGHWLTDNDDVEDKAGTNDGTNFGSIYSYDNPPMDLIPFGQRSRLFTSDYINTNTGFQSVFQSSFSISTWVRFDDGIPANSNIIFGNQSAAPISRVLIFLDNAGALTFGYFSNGLQARAEIDQNFANGDTGWFHYTAVVEPTGITIYKDGSVQTLDATDDGDMSAVTMGDYGTDIDCYIGARNLNGSPDLNMTGNIADFRIYDSALSASDVTKIYNRTDEKSNIHAWYLTNSDDVLDHAGTNDGTNNGSTYSTDSPS